MFVFKQVISLVKFIMFDTVTDMERYPAEIVPVNDSTLPKPNTTAIKLSDI